MQKFHQFFPGAKGLVAAALTAALSGALVVPALPPFGLWPFVFFGMSLFYIVLANTPSTGRAVFLGWCFGFGYFTAGLWWIANALLVEGNPYLWAYPLAVAGLPALLALFPAFAALLVKKLSPAISPGGFLGFAVIFALTEWLRGHLFTGLPWNLTGYVWSGQLPMIQISAIGGPYLLSFLTILWATLPGFLLLWKAKRGPKILLASLAIITVLLTAAFGIHRIDAHPARFNDHVYVRVVQPDIDQAEKWQPELRAKNLLKHLTLSEPGDQTQDGPLLIVWPETAITQSLLKNEVARDAIRTTLGHYTNEVYLITGLLRSELVNGSSGDPDNPESRYFNSLAIYNKDLERVALYDKSHLVPFGEYIPLEKLLGLVPIVNMAGFTPGNGPETFAIDHLPAAGPLICYEIIFPGQVADQDNRPAWIVNVTNDAWYGNSPGPYQHFAQARFRAIEQGVPVVRAAGTGISGVIDPLGRITARIGLGDRGAETVLLPRKIDSPTVYSRYGDMIFLITTGVCLIILIINKCHNNLRRL